MGGTVSVKPWTGIGSRNTPDAILELMRQMAALLYMEGWTLRSGGAPGADTAFEGGASPFGDYSRCEIFLPWEGFEHRDDNMVRRTEPQREAYEIAAQFHPVWDKLTSGGKRLHARNVHQILGYDVTDPQLTRFVMCWTRGGTGAGGTGQALRIARHYSVPIFDLADPRVRERVARRCQLSVDPQHPGWKDEGQ